MHQLLKLFAVEDCIELLSPELCGQFHIPITLDVCGTTSSQPQRRRWLSHVPHTTDCASNCNCLHTARSCRAAAAAG